MAPGRRPMGLLLLSVSASYVLTPTDSITNTHGNTFLAYVSPSNVHVPGSQ